jgi:hypothetical protein
LATSGLTSFPVSGAGTRLGDGSGVGLGGGVGLGWAVGSVDADADGDADGAGLSVGSGVALGDGDVLATATGSELSSGLMISPAAADRVLRRMRGETAAPHRD